MTASTATRGQTRWRFLTWPVRQIRWKIVLPYVFLTAVLAFAGSYVMTQLLTGSLEERFDNQLVDAGGVVSDNVVRKEPDHHEIVRAVAFTEGVADAVSSGDSGSLNALVRPIAVNAGVERLEVLDGEGRRVTALRLTNRESLTYEPIADG